MPARFLPTRQGDAAKPADGHLAVRRRGIRSGHADSRCWNSVGQNDPQFIVWLDRERPAMDGTNLSAFRVVHQDSFSAVKWVAYTPALTSMTPRSGTCPSRAVPPTAPNRLASTG